jgi:Flp pilus assembly protein TadB
MSLQYRRSKSLGKGTRLNVSKSGLSVSKRVGPLTLNSRGRGSLRIAPGLSFRFGKKSSGAAALIMLAIALAVFVFQVLLILLQIALVVTVWLARWAWFGCVAIAERVRARRAAKAVDELPAAPPATD